MATSIDWPYTILIILFLWIGLLLLQRGMKTWPKRLKVIDLMVVPMWFSIESITFQNTHYSLLGPLVCMFLIWGIALAIYQVFGTETFNLKRFFINWWRLVGIMTLIVFILVIIWTQLQII